MLYIQAIMHGLIHVIEANEEHKEAEKKLAVVRKMAVLHGVPEPVAARSTFERTYPVPKKPTPSQLIAMSLDDIYTILLKTRQEHRWCYCNGELNSELVAPCSCRTYLTEARKRELKEEVENGQR